MAGPWEAFGNLSDADTTTDDRPRITVRPMDPRHRDLAIRTIFGEAAQEPDEGKAAVAAVIKNRVDAGRYGGGDVARVVLAPNQFEPWSRPDARARMMALKPGDPNYDSIGQIVDGVWSGNVPDPTGGATHFYAPQAQQALGRQPPRWAQGEGQPIGRHTFYAPEGRVQTAQAQPQQTAQAPQTAGPWQAFNQQPAAQEDVPLPRPAPPEAKRPDIGRGTAFLTGAEQSANFNFADEKRGVQAAAGTPAKLQNPLSGPSDFVTGLAKLGYEYMTGGDEAAKRYAASRDEFRQQTKDAEAQYPGTTLAGNVAGAVAMPLGGALNAPTLPLRMGRGAAVGAGVGALSGAGEGTTVEDRASKAAVGTVIGGAAGGLGVPVIEHGARLIGGAVSKPINYLRAGFNSTGAVERAIGRTYRDALEADPTAANRLAQGALRPGEPQAVIDTLGEPGRRLARDASNMAGSSAEPLNRTLNERYTAQFGRFSDWLSDRMTHKDLHAFQRAEDALEKTVNRANYGRAYKDGDGGLWSPELERLIGADEVTKAMKNAASTGRGRAIADGMGGFNSSVSFENGVLKFNRGANGVPTYPNLQFWDYTRRELSGAAKIAARSGDDSSAEYLGKLSKLMNEELDRLVPTYKDARQGAFKFFQSDNAVEAGQKFVAENFDVPRAIHAMANMSPEQRVLFKDAFLERYISTLSGSSNRADLVKQVYDSPKAQKKIQAVLGPQEANALEAMLHVERVMSRSLGGVTGNSTTAQQLIAHGVAGASGGGAAGYGLGYDPTSSGAIFAVLTAGKRGIDINVAKKVAEMLVSKDPAVLDRGIKMIARSERLMSALRSADSGAARISGSQSQAVPVPAMQAIGRAEDQPEIPRPPGQP